MATRYSVVMKHGKYFDQEETKYYCYEMIFEKDAPDDKVIFYSTNNNISEMNVSDDYYFAKTFDDKTLIGKFNKILDKHIFIETKTIEKKISFGGDISDNYFAYINPERSGCEIINLETNEIYEMDFEKNSVSQIALHKTKSIIAIGVDNKLMIYNFVTDEVMHYLEDYYNYNNKPLEWIDDFIVYEKATETEITLEEMEKEKTKNRLGEIHLYSWKKNPVKVTWETNIFNIERKKITSFSNRIENIVIAEPYICFTAMNKTCRKTYRIKLTE